MKPKIAIASIVYTDEFPSLNYYRAIHLAGGYPLGLGVTDSEDLPYLLREMDALLLTGGDDISSDRFGQPPHPKAQLCSKERDDTELLLAKAFADAGKPILGICRGEQVLNVALGGDIIQHVYDLPQVTIDHKNKEVRHEVVLEGGTLLRSIFPGKNKLTVNSTHHQAVVKLAPTLTLAARSTDGLIEAYERGDNLLGVQWHPERLLDEGMEPIFRWLIAKAAQRA